MKKRLRFINKQHSRIARHQLRNDSAERFHSIARVIDQLGIRVEPQSIRMNSSFLQIVGWFALRQPNPKLAKIGRVNDEVGTEGLRNNAAYLAALGVVTEQDLKARLGRPLKIARPLLIHEIYSIAPIEHQCAMRKKPLTKGIQVGTRVLHELSQATERYLLPTVSASNKNVANLKRFSRVGCLFQMLDRFESFSRREPGERQFCKNYCRGIFLASPTELLHFRQDFALSGVVRTDENRHRSGRNQLR